MARSRPGGGAATAVTAVVLLALVVVLAVRAAVGPGGPPAAPRTAVGGAASGAIAESALDSQERHTLAEVRSGPPYDYPRDDGVTYHNENHALPGESDGWYREFTVRTPGESDRGPRRLVTGRDGEVFLTVDHYGSFREVRVGA